MNKYAVCIKEVFQKTVIVEAEDFQDAEQHVTSAIDNCMIYLDENDFHERIYSPSPYFKDGIVTDDEAMEFFHLEEKPLLLTYVGSDKSNRPVYQNGQILFVDTDPRYDRNAKLCTVLNNEFGGEPDTPISFLTKYKYMSPIFIPKRIVW